LTRQLQPQGQLGVHLSPDKQQQQVDEQVHAPTSMTAATLLAAGTIATTCLRGRPLLKKRLQLSLS
jgi:hypothetical protein